MSKFVRSSKNCEKMEKSPFWLKLSRVLEEIKGCPAKTAAISAISPKIAKNWRNHSFC